MPFFNFPIIHFRIDVQGKYLGQDLINTYMFTNENAGVNAATTAQQYETYLLHQIDLLSTSFLSHWEAVYTAISVSDAIYSLVRITSLSPDPVLRVGAVYGVNWHSDRDVPGLPSNIAAIVTRRCLTGTRRFNGRVFFGGIAQDDVASGVITNVSDTWAAMGIAVNAMQGRLITDEATFVPSVVPFRTHSDPTVPFPFRSVVRSARIPQLASQRRRLPGHGRRG